MSKPDAPGGRRPCFSITATICNLISLPVAITTIKLLDPTEDYLGYNGLAIAMITLLLFLISGFLLAVIGIFKKEQPPAFPLMLALINGVILIFAAIRLPA
ncbi:MAG: hypothetical protein P1U80_00410 [Pseudomonadales bacterium]|nr:hypothetical protein [Pseudomonadales bacterium]